MDQSLKINFQDKLSVLENLRSYSKIAVEKARRTYKDSEYKARASHVNIELTVYRGRLNTLLEEQAQNENWAPERLLGSALLLMYCSYIVMLEARNEVWPYEYMAFARRIGELWEPFCLLCWKYPVNPAIKRTTPPTFKEVKENLASEIDNFVKSLDLTKDQIAKLNSFYQLVWNLVVSGEIQLKSDLHFKDEQCEYVVDFKSGFSSNEKGNTNRLLMVASIYRALGGYDCMLFVRSREELNNHYLQTIKNSGLWKVYCGNETYERIARFTHFDLLHWIKTNIDWQDDFSPKMYKHLADNDLIRYLEW